MAGSSEPGKATQFLRFKDYPGNLSFFNFFPWSLLFFITHLCMNVQSPLPPPLVLVYSLTHFITQLVHIWLLSSNFPSWVHIFPAEFIFFLQRSYYSSRVHIIPPEIKYSLQSSYFPSRVIFPPEFIFIFLSLYFSSRVQIFNPEFMLFL